MTAMVMGLVAVKAAGVLHYLNTCHHRTFNSTARAQQNRTRTAAHNQSTAIYRAQQSTTEHNQLQQKPQ
jgi:hypothetical protein